MRVVQSIGDVRRYEGWRAKEAPQREAAGSRRTVSRSRRARSVDRGIVPYSGRTVSGGRGRRVHCEGLSSA